MMTMRPEASLESYFIKQAQLHNVLQYKFLSGITGVPDRILICPKMTAFVELKAENGKLSKRQKFVIKSMRNHGAIVLVPFSKADIDDIFDEIKRNSIG